MTAYPLSMPPGAIIGYRKNGCPIRITGGGSEPAPEPPATPAPAAPEPLPAPAPAPPGGSEPAPAPEPPASGQEPQGDPEPDRVDKLPSWAQREFRKLRDEAAGNRVRAKELADAQAAAETNHTRVLDGIAKALGLKPEEVTPDQIAAERDTAKAAAEQAAQRARQSDVKLAVLQHAFAGQADGNALLDSVQFLRTVDALDPAAEDFGARVKDAIAVAVEANPRYKADAGLPAAPPPPPSSPPQPQVPASGPGQGFTSPPPGPRQWTEEDVARSNPSELTKAMEAGLLENLGFGRTRKHQR